MSLPPPGPAFDVAFPGDRIAFPEASPTELHLMREAEPWTMTSIQRRWALIAAVKHICAAEVEGDVAECGVWRGGSAFIAARTLLAAGDDRRTLWLYDTFEGMARPAEDDLRLADGQSALQEWQAAATSDTASDWCRAGVDEVAAVMAASGYPAARTRLVAGPVEQTLLAPANLPERLALLRLDTDWYSSTRLELEVLYDRLAPGGVLILDDYGYWSGAKRAVDDFFAARGEPVLMHRIDECARTIVKSPPR